MGCIAVGDTVMGGLKAVISTDTVQWAILISGLVFIGLPASCHAVGGWEAVRRTLRPEMLTLTDLSWQDLVNRFVTIVPIWFVGMTLYQRPCVCADERTGFVAGLLEWPVTVMRGVALGVLARVAAG